MVRAPTQFVSVFGIPKVIQSDQGWNAWWVCFHTVTGSWAAASGDRRESQPSERLWDYIDEVRHGFFALPRSVASPMQSRVHWSAYCVEEDLSPELLHINATRADPHVPHQLPLSDICLATKVEPTSGRLHRSHGDAFRSAECYEKVSTSDELRCG